MRFNNQRFFFYQRARLLLPHFAIPFSSSSGERKLMRPEGGVTWRKSEEEKWGDRGTEEDGEGSEERSVEREGYKYIIISYTAYP